MNDIHSKTLGGRFARCGHLALRYSAACGLSLAFTAAVGAQNASSNWTQFRGNTLLTGVASSTLPEQLSVRWTYEAENGVPFDSSAAIVDGVVYVGTGGGDLLAIDLATGKLRWKYYTKSAIGESSPAVANGMVVVGDLDGTVHAVNIKDGSKLWTFKTGGEVRASPTIVNGLVLIGSYDENLYALDAAKGTLKWMLETDGAVHATATVMNNIVYITGCDEQFRWVRITDGHELFKVSTGAYTGASPLIDGGKAYFGTFNADVMAVDLATHKNVWTYKNPEHGEPFYSSAVMVDHRLIFGGRDKIVHALDAATGKTVWEFATRARVDSSPVLSGGRIYIGSSDGKLYVLDPATGMKLSEFEAGTAITASPAIAGGRLVIGTKDGHLYCLG